MTKISYAGSVPIVSGEKEEQGQTQVELSPSRSKSFDPSKKYISGTIYGFDEKVVTLKMKNLLVRVPRENVILKENQKLNDVSGPVSVWLDHSYDIMENSKILNK